MGKDKKLIHSWTYDNGSILEEKVFNHFLIFPLRIHGKWKWLTKCKYVMVHIQMHKSTKTMWFYYKWL